MFDTQKLEHAIALQHEAYEFLLLVSFRLKNYETYDSARCDVSISLGAKEWFEKKPQMLPKIAQATQKDTQAFFNLMDGFFKTSFCIEGSFKKTSFFKKLFLNILRIQPFRLELRCVYSEDQKIAKNLMRQEFREQAKLLNVDLGLNIIDQLMKDKQAKEYVAICVYAKELLNRMAGKGIGAPALSLWRVFAWESSPKKGFELSALQVIEAQELLKEKINAYHQIELNKIQKRQEKKEKNK